MAAGLISPTHLRWLSDAELASTRWRRSQRSNLGASAIALTGFKLPLVLPVVPEFVNCNSWRKAKRNPAFAASYADCLHGKFDIPPIAERSEHADNSEIYWKAVLNPVRKLCVRYTTYLQWGADSARMTLRQSRVSFLARFATNRQLILDGLQHSSFVAQ